MYNIKLVNEIPAPERVNSDYYIACHYYPGWKRGGLVKHQGFYDLEPYPERTPLLGYYNEDDPDVADWQIKWAVEHGINSFVFCWYRLQSNVGSPVTRKGLRLGDALHDGFLKAKFRDMMDFAIMWECDEAWGRVSDQSDLLDNILPFWADNYFNLPCYQQVNGMPVVFVYQPNRLINAFGSVEACREAFEACSEKAKTYGFNGVCFMADHNVNDALMQKKYLDAGFCCTFQYIWDSWVDDLTPEQHKQYIDNNYYMANDYMVDLFLKLMREKRDQSPETSILTASSMRDSHPWYQYDFCDYGPEGPIIQFALTPKAWRTELEGMKKVVDSYPEGSFGKKIIMLDNWNEWSEGHYIAPHLGNGFQYLQAVREVFTHRDNLPDYRTPEMIGLGPYDSDWVK